MIKVDRTLAFSFSDGWTALKWDGCKEQRALSQEHHKVVDIIAAGPFALVVEVKDDRAKTRAKAMERAKEVRSGAFFAEVARKFVHSVEDVVGVASDPAARVPFPAFAARWRHERRCLLFWWEVPRTKPLGVLRDDHLAAFLSPLRHLLRKEVRELSARVEIVNQRFPGTTLEFVTVSDIKDGIVERRADVRAREEGKARPTPKARRRG